MTDRQSPLTQTACDMHPGELSTRTSITIADYAQLFHAFVVRIDAYAFQPRFGPVG